MTDASRSVCIGYNAVVGSTPSGNVCIGADAGSGLVAGGSNVCIGNFSAVGTTTSGANVVIGASAGTTLTAGTSLTLIGNNTQGAAGVLSNATAIGNGASVSASNSIQLGNTSITLLRCQVALTVVSDARDKADVETLPDALPILADLRPVKYRWDNRSRYDDGVSDGSKKDTAYTTGFIAQEIQQARASHNADWLDAVYDGDPDHLGVTHERLLPLIVKAAQELAAKATAAEARAAAAEARLAALEAAVATLQAG